MQNRIIELDLNEIEAVAGGATYINYATLSAPPTMQTNYTATAYVKPTYTSPSLSSTSLSMYPAPKLI